MKRFSLVFGLMAILWTAQSPAQSVRPGGASRTVTLRFVDTDASEVLMAAGRAFRANLILPAQLKKSVSVNLTVGTLDEALRSICGAAGLVYRRINDTYVVALPADLKQALETQGTRVIVSLKALAPTEAVAIVETSLPYLSARAAGTQLVLVGAPEDIEQAKALVQEQEGLRAMEPVGSDSVSLHNAVAEQIAGVVRDMFPTLKVSYIGQAEKPGGVVSVAGPRSALPDAMEAIKKLDVPTGSRDPERIYHVYTVKYSSAPMLQEFLSKTFPELTVMVGPEAYSLPMPVFAPITQIALGGSTGGGTGGSGGGGGAGGGGGSGVVPVASGPGGLSGSSGVTGEASRRGGDRAKMIVIAGDKEAIAAALKVLEETDIRPAQVMVEVKVVDTSPELAADLGVSWNWGELKATEVPAGTATENINKFTRPLAFGAWSRLPLTLGAKLNALVTNKEAKILANPRMMVTDNDNATIFIGDTIRTQASSASISGTTVQVMEFPVGIILLVRPRVNVDGRVTLRIHPVVSTVTSVNSDNLPQTSTREAETTVQVDDGETVVIGGLIRDEMTKTIQEVPYLSKLPIVGQLFQNRQTTHKNSEVMVFITPRVVK